MAVMVDSCVYLDVFSEDSRWFAWSSDALASAADAGGIVLNSVIYSEISVRFDRIEELEALLPPEVFSYLAIPREAAFLAGKCFVEYRRRGGSRVLPLPDFFIGAHAAVSSLPLVTRDARRFREYFPKLGLICP
jgi:predicted nucleic acid-binding protein